MKKPHLILGIGELLWDLLPEAEPSSSISSSEVAPRGHLGGAPANFAVMAARLGNRAVILSRIGNDELGRKAVEQLNSLAVETAALQLDREHETGRVTVAFLNGQPQYTIHAPAAWDFMQVSDSWMQTVEQADALCFGSLAQRAPDSRFAIQSLAAQAADSCVRVFDVNLRAPYFSAKVIQESLDLATVVKMNDDEVPLVLELLGLPVSDANAPQALRGNAQRLLAEFPALQMVAVTRGSHGSLLVNREEWHEHPGFPVQVADTIGAGDAFTAAMTHYLLRGADLATLNEAGNRWGAWVASQAGAMPAVPDAVRQRIATAIES
jgi:fructokinase